eukprot:TRINITY_DN20820_c0_g1_i1.p2 TRINITY_DN20820_c0_g1~~TRINITY_DN20820_c0_g1_i1.p2  ORF type:complete len:372 (+),score=108.96 TRINITY_DN20820_c0_g1_i1:91-1116(+)
MPSPACQRPNLCPPTPVSGGGAPASHSGSATPRACSERPGVGAVSGRRRRAQQTAQTFHVSGAAAGCGPEQGQHAALFCHGASNGPLAKDRLQLVTGLGRRKIRSQVEQQPAAERPERQPSAPPRRSAALCGPHAVSDPNRFNEFLCDAASGAQGGRPIDRATGIPATRRRAFDRNEPSLVPGAPRASYDFDANYDVTPGHARKHFDAVLRSTVLSPAPQRDPPPRRGRGGHSGLARSRSGPAAPRPQGIRTDLAPPVRLHGAVRAEHAAAAASCFQEDAAARQERAAAARGAAPARQAAERKAIRELHLTGSGASHLLRAEHATRLEQPLAPKVGSSAWV